MPMADNTKPEQLEEPVNIPPENPPGEAIDITETETNQPDQATENMEVHHHTHAPHGKKTWKDYFWEFLMLFLAVFCGFLAEYQLEHKLEKDRAEELAKSFYYELKNDSATAVIKMENRIKQEEALKSITRYFKDSSLAQVTKSFAINFEYGINFRTPSIFEPKTIILEQLKNSGSLRYFKNDELQTLIGDLTVAIKNIYDRQELESQNRLQYINPIIIQLYDYDFDARLKEGGKSVFEGVKEYETGSDTIAFHIEHPEKFDTEAAIRILNFYGANVISSTRVTFVKRYMEVNAALLKLLRSEYHLE
ncbi:MAG TPA: hypothetical protein PLZ45_10220 [Ferruginibacter sp.]|nr:hypothetical protein [Ferruginibacter sp.]